MHCGEVEGFATTLLAATAGNDKNGAKTSAPARVCRRFRLMALLSFLSD
jgi:hypothetical protein